MYNKKFSLETSIFLHEKRPWNWTFIVHVSRSIHMELLGGFEPPTSSLPRTRSTNWAIAAFNDYYDIIVKFTTIVKPYYPLFNKNLKTFQKIIPLPKQRDYTFTYFAYSTPRNSLMTLTLIWPGYSNSASIFLAISFARKSACASSTCSGFTITRTSLPAWIA